ncbi:MAG: hypothetical protein Q4G50_02000 [Corynebacterium sp.]|uniref:hypothetical protein n=1 Tax=Corynebacterium sp. TaxID=1720 RepID=UPI0026DFED90|nr:hypothetical protein [Corynebacterium sp.]MDO5668755.1 hypothetical protein [Corynebacterium sp.]
MSTPVRRVADALRADLLSRSNLKILAGLALVGVLGLFGGFQAADSDTPRYPLIDAPSPITAAPVDVVVHGTGPITDFFGGEIDTVNLTVTNAGTRPVDALTLGQILGWEGQEESTFATTLRTDGSSVGVLNPGVPVDISVQLPDGAAVLVINSMTWRASNLDGSMQFFDPTPVAEVVL